MPNESTYRDCKCKPDEISHNADYVHNSSTPVHCCDNDKCECHHPLRLWSIKYEVLGVPKFTGVAIVQAKDLCNAELVFIQNSKFNGMREYLKITCIDELYPNPEPLILQEDSAAILDKRILKTYPFLLRSEYYEKSQELNDTIIQNVQDYIGDIRPHIDSTTGNWFIGDQDTGVHAQGDKGEDGNDGADGFSPLVSVSKSGATTTISVTDEQGTTSSTITDGSDGESAYEIWLEQGHTGTEEDFLNWLREGEYLKQIQNLDNYEGEIDEIVQYKGETNSKYTNGFIYKKVGTQTIIPAGTKYINVQDTSGRLAAMNVPNGIYYKVTDPNDTVVNKIRYYLFLKNENSTSSDCVPVTYINNVPTPIVGVYGCANLVFSKITSYQVENYWYATLENGSTISRIGSSQEAFVDSGLFVNIYENPNGKRIYIHRTYQGNDEYDCVLLLDYSENLDIYPVIAPLNAFKYKVNTTSSSETIGVDEWQQWDVQPRDDTSHFVTDTEIGWIEH